MFVRACSKTRQNRTCAPQIGTDKETEASGDLRTAKWTPERNGLRHARVTAELLHVPPRYEAP